MERDNHITAEGYVLVNLLTSARFNYLSNIVFVIKHVTFGRSSAFTRNLTAETSSKENIINGVGQSAPAISESGPSTSKVSGLSIRVHVSLLFVPRTMNVLFHPRVC